MPSAFLQIRTRKRTGEHKDQGNLMLKLSGADAKDVELNSVYRVKSFSSESTRHSCTIYLSSIHRRNLSGVKNDTDIYESIKKTAKLYIYYGK